MASNKCYDLSVALYSKANLISYEDAQMASNQLIQCAINVQTGVNSPLQKRTIILDLDLLRANQSSGGQIDVLTQNTYEQSQLADRIHNQVTKMISLNTLTLSIHLNLGQYLKMSSPQSFISLEMILIHSLEDKIISQIANAQFQLSKDITYHLSNNSMILIRVRFCRESFFILKSIISSTFFSQQWDHLLHSEISMYN